MYARRILKTATLACARDGRRRRRCALDQVGLELATPLTLDPHAQNEGPTHNLLQQIYEPLIVRDLPGNLSARPDDR